MPPRKRKAAAAAPASKPVATKKVKKPAAKAKAKAVSQVLEAGETLEDVKQSSQGTCTWALVWPGGKRLVLGPNPNVNRDSAAKVPQAGCILRRVPSLSSDTAVLNQPWQCTSRRARAEVCSSALLPKWKRL